MWGSKTFEKTVTMTETEQGLSGSRRFCQFSTDRRGVEVSLIKTLKPQLR